MCSLRAPSPLAHLALVHAIARTLYRGTLELEDLVQEGILGLLRAARHYNPLLGRPAPFYGRRIRWAMLDAIERHERLTARLIQADELDVADEHAAQPFELEEWLADLTGRERYILELWLGLTGDGVQLNCKEISRQEGVSRQRIQQIVQAALAKVKERAAQHAGR